MGNLVPPNQKARSLKTSLEIILGAHFFVAIAKMVLLGIFSGLTDLFACMILWCGLCRYDYCNMFIYQTLVLFDIFQLLIVLGFYFQTQQGKNLPLKKRNGTFEDPEAEKAELTGSDKEEAEKFQEQERKQAE
jgi:nitric oxide reductase large subunit